MNSEEEGYSTNNSIDSQSQVSADEIAEVFPIDDDSGDEMERQLEDFKKFNSNKLVKVKEEEVEEEEGWGRSRRDYYGASESEEDEGEAIKIQKALLQKIREEDYYGEFTEETESYKVEKKPKKMETYGTEKFNSHLIEAVELLKRGEYDPDYLTLKFLYLTNLSFYFSLVNGPEHENRMSHPVVQRIDEIGSIIEKINGSRMTLDDEMYVSQSDKEELELDDETIASTQEDSKLDQEIVEGGNEESFSNDFVSKDEISDNDEDYQAIVEKKNKKKITDTFGEAEKLNEVDLLDKNNRRKALNFRVSQVERSLMQKSLQRSGDDDLPFKTKARKESTDDLEERSNSEGEIASQVDYSHSEDNLPETDIFGEDEYYQKIKAEKMAKKKEREEKYEQLNEPLVDYWVEPELEDDEKRKATWRILANRGLTPFRKKENRNPRVKKRLKYEKAVKKLPSTRRVAVDKKKLSKYGGELTGIKSNLARSTKF